MIAALSAAINDAIAAGDMEAARIAHESIARLISSSSTAPADVIELAAERARRGG